MSEILRANDVSGTSWGASLIVDNNGDTGRFCSLAIVNGRPAVAYVDFGNADLRYVRALDDNGTSWSTPLTVDSASNVDWYVSLAVAAGRPAIAYPDGTPNGDLKYVYSLDDDGTSWATPLTVDSQGYTGRFISMADIGGRPAVAYQDQTNFDLKYVEAADTTGTVWGVPVTVDSAGDVGAFASLLEVDGRPAIAYYDWTNGDLRYAIRRP